MKHRNKFVSSVSTGKSLTFVLLLHGGKKTYSLKASDDRYSQCMRLVESKDADALLELMDTDLQIAKASGGKIKVSKKLNAPDSLNIGGDDLPEEIAGRIRETVAQSLDPSPFVKFWERLKKNPSENSKKQLYVFVKNCDMNITADGHVILYKGVNGDLYSNHASHHYAKGVGKIPLLHTTGSVIEIPREDCVDNPSISCSTGLHCAPWKYVQDYYSRLGNVVELLVDPADIVSIPNDGGGHKLRVCKYRVLRTMGAGDTPKRDTLATRKVSSSGGQAKIREIGKKFKTSKFDTIESRLQIIPEAFYAIGVESGTELTLFSSGEFILIGRKDAHIPEAAFLAKYKKANTYSDKTGVRNSLTLKLAHLKTLGAIQKSYEVKRVLVGKVPYLKVTKVIDKANDADRVVAKATSKVVKKAAKKATKKTTKKVAKKTPKKA